MAGYKSKLSKKLTKTIKKGLGISAMEKKIQKKARRAGLLIAGATFTGSAIGGAVGGVYGGTIGGAVGSAVGPDMVKDYKKKQRKKNRKKRKR